MRRLLLAAAALASVARADDHQCSTDWCTSPGLLGHDDCWAGSEDEPCSCSTGEARETGQTQENFGVTYYEYTCCVDGDAVGEECGDFGALVQDDCSQDRCRSPNGEGGYDCWAGSAGEACACSAGEARETGQTVDYDGTKYYEYTCCIHGSNVGEECGDNTHESAAAVMGILAIIVFCACLVCGVALGVAKLVDQCGCCNNAANPYQQQQQQGGAMELMNPTETSYGY